MSSPTRQRSISLLYLQHMTAAPTCILPRRTSERRRRSNRIQSCTAWPACAPAARVVAGRSYSTVWRTLAGCLTAAVASRKLLRKVIGLGGWCNKAQNSPPAHEPCITKYCVTTGWRALQHLKPSPPSAQLSRKGFYAEGHRHIGEGLPRAAIRPRSKTLQVTGNPVGPRDDSA